MARDLSQQQGIGNDPNYLNGNLVDNQTLIGEGINQDLVQFFQKLMQLASLTANGNPDNEANGYQFIEALEKVVRTYASSTIQKGVVEKATTTEAQNGTADKFLDAALLQAVTATETRKGVAEIATQAEVDAGTDDTRFVTPAKLQQRISNIKTEIIDIGSWDMDASTSLNVSWTQPSNTDIVSISGIIYPDSQNGDAYPIWFADVNNNLGTYIYYEKFNNQFRLFRSANGFFDSTNFNDASINRGKIIVQYI